MTRTEILEHLAAVDVAEASGGLIEKYCDNFAIDEGAVPIFERFLYSSEIDNRNSALMALVAYGKRPGYEADVLQLYLDGCDQAHDNEQRSAVGYLELLNNNGSSVAKRILYNLQRNEQMKEIYDLAERYDFSRLEAELASKKVE